MKYAVDGDHRNFFQKHHRIEFDGLLSSEQIKACNTALNEVLCVRLSKTLANVNRLPSETLFMAGHDLWRAHPVIKKIVTQRTYGEVAAELFLQQPLRLAYDQLIIPPTPAIIQTEANPVYVELIEKGATLESMSGIQGIIGGLMLCLSDAPIKVEPEGEVKEKEEKEEEPENKLQETSLFANQAGNGVFFDNTVVIPFSELAERQNQRFLLIVYTQQVSVYVMQKTDPHLHHLKRFGYQFGDKLSIKHHPIIFR